MEQCGSIRCYFHQYIRGEVAFKFEFSLIPRKAHTIFPHVSLRVWRSPAALCKLMGLGLNTSPTVANSKLTHVTEALNLTSLFVF